jgi:hypothetical protein
LHVANPARISHVKIHLHSSPDTTVIAAPLPNASWACVILIVYSTHLHGIFARQWTRLT